MEKQMTKRTKKTDPEMDMDMIKEPVVEEAMEQESPEPTADENPEDASDQLETFYATLAQSIQEFAENTRQAVVDFEFSREDLVKVSIAVDMMANSLNLLRNYVNFYLDDVDPTRYHTLFMDLNNLKAGVPLADYVEETTLEDELKTLF
jgi:hypothetical protein